ncbi:MAG: septum formation initiator family protein [Acidobacteriota bacterium]|nr:septum formation initiator family protein [Acidobacteriota bacterium]
MLTTSRLATPTIHATGIVRKPFCQQIYQPSTMPAHNGSKKRKPRTADRTRRPSRRALLFLLLFISTALVANAIIGERGLIATRAAERDAMALAADIETIQSENNRLRAQAKGLRDDPNAIESVARDELGLMRKGELLILLHDGPGVANR